MEHHPVIFINGQFEPADEGTVSTKNRAFRYGDGCFEAIRVTNGKPVFWNWHHQRLTETLALLQIDHRLTSESLLGDVMSLIRQNGIEAGAMLRIMVYRDGGGTYFPESNEAEVFMEVKPLEHNAYEPCEEGRSGLVYDQLRLPSHRLGNHKTLNKTIHVSAAVQCQKYGVEDAIVCNDQDHLCEAISSNLFLVLDDTVLTPPLSSGCLNGTIRKVIQANQEVLPFALVERDITRGDLLRASEVWTTNAGSAVKWFSEIEGKSYSGQWAKQTQQKLKELAISSIRDFPETQP